MSVARLSASIAMALLANVAAAQTVQPDPVFANAFENGAESLLPNLTYVQLGFSNATTEPTPLTLTLTDNVAMDTFVPITSSDPMRVAIVGGGVTIAAGTNSAQVRVNASIQGPVPVTISAALGNRVAAGVRVEAHLNETGQPGEADFCNLQFPQSILVSGGQATPLVFGRLFEAGVTETAGAPMGWIAQLGYGPNGSDPRLLDGWTFFDASYNLQVMNDDEFMASFVAPRESNSYDYTYRFSNDGGGNWTYCDLDGAGSNPGSDFSAAQLGDLIVLTPFDGIVINEIDYDQPGADTAEFAEILNTSSNTIDLQGLALVFVNGADNTEYLRITLGQSGTLAPGEYLVVRQPGVMLPGGVKNLLVNTGMPFFQDGAPDALALVDTTNRVIVDSFSYEGSVTAAQITGFVGTVNLVEGTPTSIADDASGARSLARIPNGADTNNANADWFISISPTPGSLNMQM